MNKVHVRIALFCAAIGTTYVCLVFHFISSPLQSDFTTTESNVLLTNGRNEEPIVQQALPEHDCSKQNDQILSNALERIKVRNAYLATNNTDISEYKTGGPPAFHGVHILTGTTMSLLAPYYTCPWTLKRTNYVSQSQFDGGKWTCGVEEMEQCVVYSFGSNNDDFFERDLHYRNPSCEIHIFDPTSGAPPEDWKEKYYFHPLGLCVGDESSFRVATIKDKIFPCKSLEQHMRTLGHSHVDIVKADVEGMEFALLQDWQQHNTRIGQLLLEFHFWFKSPRFPEFLRNYIIPLERAGYFLQTLEPVGAKHEAYEVSFLNVNWSPNGIDRGIWTPEMYPITPGVVL